MEPSHGPKIVLHVKEVIIKIPSVSLSKNICFKDDTFETLKPSTLDQVCVLYFTHFLFANASDTIKQALPNKPFVPFACASFLHTCLPSCGRKINQIGRLSCRSGLK